MIGVIAAIQEFLFMHDAIRAAEELDDDTRQRATAAFDRASQKRRAAEALDAAGAFAEAIRAANEGAAALRDGWKTLEERQPKRAGSSSESLLDAIERLDSPSRDGEVPAVLQVELRRALRLIDASCSELFVRTRDVRGLARVRVRRWLECAAVLVGIVFMIRLAYEVRYGVHIRASTELSPTWSADRAIDGDKYTDWVASDGGAWIELQFHAPRAFHHVWLRNGEFFPDRGAKDVKVELYDEDAVRWSTVKTFVHTPSEYLQFEPNGARASRVRVTALSFYGASAAISEITWD